MSGDSPLGDEGGRPGAGPMPLDEIYDEATLALIEAHGVSAASSVRRLGAQGAVLAGVMLGLGEVFEPDQSKQAMVEFVPDAVDRSDEPIEFVYVHGFPRRSRIVVRPWLMR